MWSLARALMFNTMASNQPSSESTKPAPRRWWKWLASAMILFHCLAVFVPPLAFNSRSLHAETAFGAVRGYSEFLYLDRGYAFFAPDPGPAQLLQAAVVQPDGTLSESRYPNLEQQWPRLNYHRHFMLAEYLQTIYVERIPLQLPIDLADSQELQDQVKLLRAERARYEHVRLSFADHLSHLNDGKRVVLARVEHIIPPHNEFLSQGIDLADKELYLTLQDRMLDLGTGEVVGPPEAIPAPAAATPNDGDLLKPRSGPVPETALPTGTLPMDKQTPDQGTDSAVDDSKIKDEPEAVAGEPAS